MQLSKEGRRDHRNTCNELPTVNLAGNSIFYLSISKGIANYLCSVCSGDVTLFSEPFSARVGNINKSGNTSCGCNPRYKWSESQNITRVQRLFLRKGLRFVGWGGQYKGSTTPIEGFCNEHKVSVKVSSLNSLLNPKSNPCILCRKGKCREKSNNAMGKLFYEKYPDKVLIGFYDKTDPKKVTFTCKVCEKDYYARGGLSSTFEGSVYNSVACRCSSRYNYSESERTFMISKTFLEEGSKFTFLSWVTGYKSSRSKFRYSCVNHGEQEASFWDFRSGCRCSSCAKSGFKKEEKAFLYFVRWYNATHNYIKFGVTGSMKDRISSQKTASTLSYEVLEVIPCDTGLLALQYENKIKTYTKGSHTCPKSLLRDGWTETVPYTEQFVPECKLLLNIK